MAKHTHHVKMSDCHNAEIKGRMNGKSEIILSGRNSQGTLVKITITVDDYFLKYLHRDMVEIATRRVADALELKKAIVSGE